MSTQLGGSFDCDFTPLPMHIAFLFLIIFSTKCIKVQFYGLQMINVITTIDVKEKNHDSCFDFIRKIMASRQKHLNLMVLGHNQMKKTSLIC